MRKHFIFLIMILGFLCSPLLGYCDENRFTFNDASGDSTFADLFSDSQDADWYRLWTGDSSGSTGNYVDTSGLNDVGKGWIEKDDLSQLSIDFAHADATELWVKPWDSVNLGGSWAHGSVDFSSATLGKVTRTITGSASMDQMFVDQDVSEDTWYRIWLGNADGSGDYMDTSSLNAYAPGWVSAGNLSQLTYALPTGQASQEMWVKVFSMGRSYGWEHWTVSDPSQAYTMTDYFPVSGSWETDHRTLFTGVLTREVNGVTTREMADTLFGATMLFTNDENGLRFHGTYESGVDQDGDPDIYDTPILFAAASVFVGDKFTSTLDEDGETVHLSFQLMGAEDVTVPAGTFSACLKFRFTEWMDGQNEGDNGYETIWLAKDVGFVKSVSDLADEGGVFTHAGNTRQLLNYWVPSDLTDDQQAIHSIVASYVQAKETENLTELMALYSEDYSQGCMDKTSRQTYEEGRFSANVYDKMCVSIEEISVVDNRATAMVEYYVNGTSKSDGSRWQYAGRESTHLIKENNTWYFYGSQMDFHPYGSGYFGVFSRNQESGPYVAINAAFHDCSTGSLMNAIDGIASFTITGPPGSGLDNTSLMDSWDGSWYEFWNSSLLDYNTMPSGFYTFTVEDTLGNVYAFSDYFEKHSLLDVPSPISPLDGGVIGAGTNILSWNSVSGADTYRIDFEKLVSGSWQRENLFTQAASYTVTLDPQTSYRWRIRARQLDTLNGDDYLDNESRNDWDYFSTTAAAGSGDLILSYAYIQYRSRETGSNQYRGWCDIVRQNGLSVPGDITEIAIKDSTGNEVAVEGASYYGSSVGYFSGSYNTATSSVDYSGPNPSSGYSIRFPEGTVIPAGIYTYEATTSENETLTYSVNFSGMEALPFVNSSSMAYIWETDGSLSLSWDNPEGSYDQIRVALYDQDWNDLLYISLPNTLETVTIPASVVQDITNALHPSSGLWEVQTRSSSDGNNHARGYSATLDLPWNAN